MKNYVNIFVYIVLAFSFGMVAYSSYINSQVQKERLEYYKQSSEREDRLYQETMKMILDTHKKVIDLEKK